MEEVAAAGTGGDDEDAEPRGRTGGAQAVVLVAHVRELLVAGDGHDHVLEALVGEAVPDGAHLRAAGDLRGQPRRQVTERRRARDGEDARRAAYVPRRAVGASGQEAAAVAAVEPDVVAAAVAGRRHRHEGGQGEWDSGGDRVGVGVLAGSWVYSPDIDA